MSEGNEENLYQKSVNEGLNDAYRKCQDKLNLEDRKIIIFSDHHRGS